MAEITSVNPIFSIEVLEKNASKGRGDITSMAAGNNILLVGTSRGWIIRYNYNTGEINEIDVSIPRWGDQFVHSVFMDPTGSHGLVSLRSSVGGGETVYLHSKWKKGRVLSRLSGAIVNCVAWNPFEPSEDSTRETMIGTSGGQLFEVLVEEKDKKEKHLKLLYDLQGQREPICGLKMDVFPTESSKKIYVMAVTPTKLYSFRGSGNLEETFANYEERLPRITEFPGKFPNSEIHLSSSSGSELSKTFAWLASPGIYHGQISFSENVPAGAVEVLVSEKQLLEHSKLLTSRSPGGSTPLSLSLSRFHFLILYKDYIKVVNRVNGQVIEEVPIPMDRLDPAGGSVLRLCNDELAGTTYAYTQKSVLEVTSKDESRDMMRVFLASKQYSSALRLAQTDEERSVIYIAQAEESFQEKDYDNAAVLFSKASDKINFEDVAIKFVSVGAQDALRSFLAQKLDSLKDGDTSQMTILATWIVELYLDKVNRLYLDTKVSTNEKAGGAPGSGEQERAEYRQAVEELTAFLTEFECVLEEGTTLKLLGSYGREEELLQFALLKKKFELALQLYLQRGDSESALSILADRSVPVDLQYKYAPQLMLLDPARAVSSWMSASLELNPMRLIPALLHYSSTQQQAAPARDEAIRYLEFCVKHRQMTDSAIHNLLLCLYAKQDDEPTLIKFLTSAFSPSSLQSMAATPSDVCYDPKYALRVCLQNGRLRSCVSIYSLVGMHPEAVGLAINIDIQLAKAEANKASDEALRKKLWLMIVRHIIQRSESEARETGRGVREAMDFLTETDGLLQIEDILPFFPEFTLIDDFKEAILSSLDNYNRQIEGLKGEMEEATRGAENLRQDIASLSQRFVLIHKDKRCELCGKPLLASVAQKGQNEGQELMTPFYVFPCQHSFHAGCLTDHILEVSTEKEKVTAALDRCKEQVRAHSQGRVKVASSELDKVQSLIDEAIAGDCPFCGDLMIESITKPFLVIDDSDEESWKLD